METVNNERLKPKPPHQNNGMALAYVAINQSLTNHGFVRGCGKFGQQPHGVMARCHSIGAAWRQMSKKPGKDLATQAVSSMIIGPSAPREATVRAMAMR